MWKQHVRVDMCLMPDLMMQVIAGWHVLQDNIGREARVQIAKRDVSAAQVQVIALRAEQDITWMEAIAVLVIPVVRHVRVQAAFLVQVAKTGMGIIAAEKDVLHAGLIV